MKAGAIVSRVLFILFLLALLLPWVLDRLAGRTFSPFVGARDVRRRADGEPRLDDERADAPVRRRRRGV